MLQMQTLRVIVVKLVVKLFFQLFCNLYLNSASLSLFETKKEKLALVEVKVIPACWRCPCS